jgi:hypothetical protein
LTWTELSLRINLINSSNSIGALLRSLQ